jgi:predicted metal-dependent hydrolase
MADKDEVQELARKLDEWAENELKKYPKQQTLLRWLLSRGAYIEKRVDERRVEGMATHVFTKDIKQAVKDALEPLIRTNLPEPIDGWARSYPTWPRMGDWPRDGYCALGMGRPPKLDKKYPQKAQKLLQSE